MYILSPLSMCVRYFSALILDLLYLPIWCVVVIYFLVGRVFCFHLKHLVEQQKRGKKLREELFTSLTTYVICISTDVRLRERWHHASVQEAVQIVASFPGNIICTLSIHESYVKDSEFHVPISSITSTGMIYWVVFTNNETRQRRNLLLPFDESQIDPGNVFHLILKFTNH